jgi:hypothetical protein
MTKKKEKVPFTGQMAGNMMETGLMESNMELVYTPLPQAKLNRESGMRGRESSG